MSATSTNDCRCRWRRNVADSAAFAAAGYRRMQFAPKYRRKVFYGEKRLEIGKILRELYNSKGVNIINADRSTLYRHVEKTVQQLSQILFPKKFTDSLKIGELWRLFETK